jgi:hypothetical protein
MTELVSLLVLITFAVIVTAMVNAGVARLGRLAWPRLVSERGMGQQRRRNL